MRPILDMDFDLMDSMSVTPAKDAAPELPLTGAITDGPYTYRMWRIWDRALPMVCWVLLNPSTVDETDGDTALTKVMRVSRTWGYGGVVVVNLFAYRATDPSELITTSEGGVDVVGVYNDQHIMVAMHMCPELTLAAWGPHGSLRGRAAHVMKFCRRALGGERVLHSFDVNADGTPTHPLYLLDTSTPIPYPKE